MLVVGEIRQGIERLRGRDPGQAEVFERWLATLDGLLAATALVHGLTFVTREAKRLERTGVPLLDPWQPRPRD